MQGKKRRARTSLQHCQSQHPPEKVNQSTLKDRNPFSDPGEVFIAGREGCWELRGI